MKPVVLRAASSAVLLSFLSVPAFSAETPRHINTINGQPLPGTMAELVDTSIMLDTIDAHGYQIIVSKGTRKAGTRAKIHMHEYGGHTCVMTGEITIFIEAQGPQKFPGGNCYYMPPNVAMAALNLGSLDAVLIDTFVVPKGSPTITFLEHAH